MLYTNCTILYIVHWNPNKAYTLIAKAIHCYNFLDIKEKTEDTNAF